MAQTNHKNYLPYGKYAREQVVEFFIARQVFHKNGKKWQHRHWNTYNCLYSPVWCNYPNTKQIEFEVKWEEALANATIIIKQAKAIFPIPPKSPRPLRFPDPCHRCIYCGTILPHKRAKSRYCSLQCWRHYYDKYNWEDLSWQIFMRDDFTCALCGWQSESELIKGVRYYSTKGLNCDHIIAITNGGDPYAESNLRTLCVKCHKDKTASDLKLKASKNNDTKKAKLRKRNLAYFQVTFGTH